MLRATPKELSIPVTVDSQSPEAPPAAADILSLLRRHWPVLVGSIAAFAGLALLYILMATPLFTATATLFIDTNQAIALQENLTATDGVRESAQVDSHAEIARSRAVALQVVRRLNLTADPEFAGETTWVGNFIGWLFGTGPDHATVESATVTSLLANVAVRRIGTTYLFDISVQTQVPAKSAAIANTFADEYVEEQLKARQQAAERATAWMQTKIDELRERSIAADRAAQSYRSRNSLSDAARGAPTDQNAADALSQRRVELRELESSAQALAKAHESFLQRYTELINKMSYPIAEARVITPASVPLRKSHPRSVLTLLGSIVLGAGVGWGIAFYRHRTDRTVRSEDELRAVTGLDAIGVLPLIQRNTDQPVQVPPNSQEDMHRASHRLLAPCSDLLNFAAREPDSAFSEAIQNIKVTADLSGKDIRVIGCVSASRGEGRSTVAANLACILSEMGYRTLLMDWDLRNPYLTRSLVRMSVPGFDDLLGGRVTLGDVLWKDAQHGITFLPANLERRSLFATGHLTSGRAEEFIDYLRSGYQYIIVDLPPLAATMDARAVAHLIDGFVLVAECGRTDQDLLRRTIRNSGLHLEQFLGTILNKAEAPTTLVVPAWLRESEARMRNKLRSASHVLHDRWHRRESPLALRGPEASESAADGEADWNTPQDDERGGAGRTDDTRQRRDQ